MKAVVDTNVLISGLLWKGTPKEIIDKFRFEQSFILILSPELIQEFRIKLLRKFHLEAHAVNQWVNKLSAYAELVIPSYTTKLCRDPKDNMILDTALSGDADFIVTGDKDLLALGAFQKISILSPAKFIALL